MISWFFAGGIGMFPVLGLGLLAIGLSGCHVLAPAHAWRRSAASARAAVLLAALAAFGVDVSAVAAHLDSAAAMEAITVQMAVGLGESVMPLVLGASLASLSALLCAAGDAREP